MIFERSVDLVALTGNWSGELISRLEVRRNPEEAREMDGGK